MISKFKDIFESHKLKLWLKPFNIIATSHDGGLIETIPDAISIDKLKKSFTSYMDLRTYFVQTFGGQRSDKQSKRRLKDARNAFISSIAGYSLLCYIL
jgi:phosphatidylinositol 4-kinase B